MALLPAFAQDTNTPSQMKPVIVTGSFVPTAETVGPAPIQTLGSEQISQAGSADALITLKKLVPGFTGGANYLGAANNNVNIGAGYQAFTGESYAALRNLPTLILLNGQRVASTALSGGQAVDLNSIPLAMIDRIEVLKDGASAIYGSDAIGGVINVITKQNYSGVEISGRYGFPTEGPSDHGVQWQASIVAGTATENARFVAGASMFNQNPLLVKDRTIGSQGISTLADQGVAPPSYVSPSYPGKVQAGGTSFILASSPFAAGGPGYNPTLLRPPVYPGQSFSGGSSIINYNNYALSQGYVDPTGNGYGPYVPFAVTPTGQELAAIGKGESSAWPALNTTDFGVVSILDQHRNQFWANFDYDLYEDKATVYLNFLYSDNFAQGELAPSPAPSLNGSSIAVPANNPYNPFGIDLGLNGATTPRVRSRFVDFGNRLFVTYSDFYQFVGGLKGNLTKDLSYNVSYDYSHDRQEQQTRNAVNGGGLNSALQPLLDDGGNYVYDGQGRPLSILANAAGQNVPVYNVFGSGITAGAGINSGVQSSETVDLLRTTLFTWGQTTLADIRGVFNYASFDLPGGKVNWAFGAEHIHETIELQVDGLTQLGLVPGLNAAENFPGGSRNTTAGFVEVVIPVTSPDMDIPVMHSFEIQAAGRYQTFDPGGDKAVPMVKARWQPLDNQFTIRGGYSQGFIAPSIYNLFGPDFISNPSVSFTDPSGGVSSGQVQTQTRANSDLEPSTSDQWGVGIVITPEKLVKGLTLSVDYYNVEVDNLANADAQAAATSLNSLGSASPFAAGYTDIDGNPLTSTLPGQVNVDTWGNLIIPWTGAAALQTRGFDFSANYILPIEQKYGTVTLNCVANYILAYEYQSGTGRDFYDWVGTWSPLQGLMPNFTITPSLTYQYEGWTYVVTAHYLPETDDPGTLFPEYGLSEQGATLDGASWSIPSYFTIDMQLSYEFGRGRPYNEKWYYGTTVTVGCQNITNEQPPLIADAVEDNTDKNNYDIIGRFIYFEISKKF